MLTARISSRMILIASPSSFCGLRRSMRRARSTASTGTTSRMRLVPKSCRNGTPPLPLPTPQRNPERKSSRYVLVLPGLDLDFGGTSRGARWMDAHAPLAPLRVGTF
eukprot:3432707-Prymnesium_polylepis.1